MTSKLKRPPRKYTDSFKQQVMELHRSGTPRYVLIKAFGLTPSCFSRWKKAYSDEGAQSDPLNDLLEENMRLRKENSMLRQLAASLLSD